MILLFSFKKSFILESYLPRNSYKYQIDTSCKGRTYSTQKSYDILFQVQSKAFIIDIVLALGKTELRIMFATFLLILIADLIFILFFYHFWIKSIRLYINYVTNLTVLF